MRTVSRAGGVEMDLPRPRIIGATRGQPYQPRRYANISGMSFGALSALATPASPEYVELGLLLALCSLAGGCGTTHGDANEIMPPKSTWFEPKLKDGLLVHLI